MPLHPHARHSATALETARSAILDDPFSSDQDLAHSLQTSETTVREARRRLRSTVTAELARQLATNHLQSLQQRITDARARKATIDADIATLRQNLADNTTYYPSIQDMGPLTTRDRVAIHNTILSLLRESTSLDRLITDTYMDRQTSLVLDAFQARVIDIESASPPPPPPPTSLPYAASSSSSSPPPPPDRNDTLFGLPEGEPPYTPPPPPPPPTPTPSPEEGQVGEKNRNNDNEKKKKKEEAQPQQ